MARVQIDDETWTAFRAGLGSRPVSVVLGELVQREVGRQRRRAADDGEIAHLAIEDARSLIGELQQTVDHLERRERAARGGSPERARRASQPSLPDALDSD